MTQIVQKFSNLNPILHQKRALVLLFILFFGLFLRVPFLHLPLLDRNAWRQADTATVARNFYENNFDIFYPQVDWRGATEGYAESEFHVYPFIVAVLYRAFGVHEVIGRLVSLFFFVLSAVLLFRLAENTFNGGVAIWATLFFVISPLNMHFSRAFMPTSTLVFFSIASIYYFSRWVDEDRAYFFLASLTATALAVLLKPPSLYLGLPLLYLAVRKYGKKTFLQWNLWLFASLVIIPSFIWYHHAHQLFLQTGLTFGTTGEGYSKFGNPDYWLSLPFYKTMAKRLLFDILTPPGAFFALIGFLLVPERKNYVAFWWLVAFGVYIFIMAEGHQRHYYYQVPLVPTLSLYVGQGFYYLLEKNLFKDALLLKFISLKSVLIFLFFLMPLVALVRTSEYRHFAVDRLTFGKRIQELTEKDSLVIIGGWRKGKHIQVKYPPRDPIDLYFSHRKGWVIDLDEWTLPRIESLRQQGARYFVSYYPKGLELNKTFVQGLNDKYTLLERTERWFLYLLDNSPATGFLLPNHSNLKE